MAKKGRKKIAVIGGDARAIEAASALMARGHECSFYALEGLPGGRCREADEEKCSDPYRLYDALEGADAALLPIPISRDGKTLNAPYTAQEARLSQLLPLLPEGAKLFGGKFPEEFRRGRKADTIVDLLKDGDFAEKNALPSAEGAIGLALLNYPGVIEGSVCTVSGYGRIGRQLAKKLAALGARVIVLTRREESREAARAEGNEARAYEEAREVLSITDVLFNTAPAHIFDEEAMKTLPGESLYIELASPPYGADKDALDACRASVLFAPGLPGRYSPRYSGRMIAEKIMRVLMKQET